MITKNKFQIILILGVILLVALFLRLFRITASPARLTHDEMSLGYNAYSILKTGQDEWGRTLPLSFEAFGDYKLPGYIYSLTPIVALLGLNILSLKLPSIIAGLIIIAFTYLIAWEISKNKITALISALIVALNPWPIHLSRMALESNLGLAFFSIGLWGMLKSFSKPRLGQALKSFYFYPILTGLLLGLACYTYLTFRLLSVSLLIALFFINLIYKNNLKKFFIICLVFVLTLLPLSSQILGKSGFARFSQVSIFSSEGLNSKIIEQRNFCFLQERKVLPQLCKILYNKPYYLGEQFAKNYLSFLLPSFLFLQGDQLKYLNDPNFGEFYLVLTPFYLIGFYSIFKKKNQRSNLFLSAFFLAPIASALAGKPQIIRGSTLIIFVSIFIGQGIWIFLQFFKNKNYQKILGSILAIIIAFSFLNYFISYLYIYPAKFGHYFYPLDQRILPLIEDKEDLFKTIYFNSSHFPDAHILLAFYWQIDPTYYQKNIARATPDNFGFSHPRKLGKYEFGNLSFYEIMCSGKTKTLYITRPFETPKSWSFETKPIIIKDFSNVHTQVELYDLDFIKTNLIRLNLLDATCTKYK